MPDLNRNRTALLWTLRARERRLYFDWIAEQLYAIADYAKAHPSKPPALEPIRLTVLVGPTVEV